MTFRIAPPAGAKTDDGLAKKLVELVQSEIEKR
jgi:hypothetical protein